MLDERKTAILRAVVQEYVTTGQPVGSSHVARMASVNVSSATVRNEMAILEQEGYLAQPHTSAGRIPSQLGYRLYVDQLLPEPGSAARQLERELAGISLQSRLPLRGQDIVNPGDISAQILQTGRRTGNFHNLHRRLKHGFNLPAFYLQTLPAHQAAGGDIYAHITQHCCLAGQPQPLVNFGGRERVPFSVVQRGNRPADHAQSAGAAHA